MMGFEKRWQFAAVAADKAFVSAAVAHFGYLGYAFAYVHDHETGRMRQFRHIVPLGLGTAVEQEPDVGSSWFWSPLQAITIAPAADTLVVRAGDWSVDVAFAPSAEPFDATWTIPGGGPHRTRKKMGQAAVGTLLLDGREVSLEGWGLKDWSRGHPARETAWRWAAGVGKAGGKLVAWNLRTGFDDPTECENAVWVDFDPARVGRATIDPGPTWRVAAGPLVLDFHPDGQHREDLDLLLLASRYTQPWGRFTGTWDGVPLEGYGVVEDHWARW